MMIVWAAQQRFSVPGPLKKFGAQRQLAKVAATRNRLAYVSSLVSAKGGQI